MQIFYTLLTWCILVGTINASNDDLSTTTTAFHVYREHEQGDLRMWYMPNHSTSSRSNPTLYNIGAKHMRIDVLPDLNIDIRVNDEYIIADTFSIYVNDMLRFICYYDDDDHQTGNLVDIVINEQAFTYSINAGSQATCTPANE